MTKNNYMPHIGGLRCMAIMMIIMFHMFPHQFPYGFLGVEVFLVISGFLLFKGYIKDPNFSLLNFTKKKILRIIPTLVWVLIITILCIFPVLFGEEETSIIGKSALCSLCGISNFYYNDIYADYFSVGANMNPLLHTWYLSVIIQIYILWAIGCKIVSQANIYLNKANKKTISRIATIFLLFVIAFTSFLYYCSPVLKSVFHLTNISFLQFDSAPSYYNTAARIWQVLIGGLVFLMPEIPHKKTRTFLVSVGLVVISFSAFKIFSIKEINSCIVVFCTLVVIRYAPCTIVDKLLSLRCVQFISIISFSLYLIHFPIIAIYKHWTKLTPGLMSGGGLLIVAILLSWLLWVTVEKRKYQLNKIAYLSILAVGCGGFMCYADRLGVSMAACSNLKYPVYALPEYEVDPVMKNGFHEKLLEPHCGIAVLMLNDGKKMLPDMLPLGKKGIPEFVVIGDSNAQHFYSGFNEICKEKELCGIQLATVILSFEDFYVDLNLKGYVWTREKYTAFLNWLEQHPEIHTIVISQLWDKLNAERLYDWEQRERHASFNDKKERLRRFCDRLKAMNKNIILVSPSPFFKLDKDLHGDGLSYARWLICFDKIKTFDNTSPFVLSMKEYNEKYQKVITLFNEWEKDGYCDVLHIEKEIFKEGNYLGIKNGVLYCRDATHITPYAAMELLKGRVDDFVKLIKKGREKCVHPGTLQLPQNN